MFSEDFMYELNKWFLLEKMASKTLYLYFRPWEKGNKKLPVVQPVSIPNAPSL